MYYTALILFCCACILSGQSALMRFNELNQTYALLPFYAYKCVSGRSEQTFPLLYDTARTMLVIVLQGDVLAACLCFWYGSVTRCSDIPGATMKMFGGSPWFYRKMSWFHGSTG